MLGWLIGVAISVVSRVSTGGSTPPEVNFVVTSTGDFVVDSLGNNLTAN